LVERYFNYYPETKSVTDERTNGHEDPYIPPTLVERGYKKWEIHFGIELPWEEIWGRHFNNLANRKSKQLQWELLHRIIYTEERLQKMNKSPNGSCHFCKDPNM